MPPKAKKAAAAKKPAAPKKAGANAKKAAAAKAAKAAVQAVLAGENGPKAGANGGANGAKADAKAKAGAKADPKAGALDNPNGDPDIIDVEALQRAENEAKAKADAHDQHGNGPRQPTRQSASTTNLSRRSASKRHTTIGLEKTNTTVGLGSQQQPDNRFSSHN